MRITSGILKGRQFKVPKSGVRPTTERTREAVFSSLAARVPGARVLDLFAGAGGLGLEAWSRGAASVTAVEKSSSVWKILSENFQCLEPGLRQKAAAGRPTVSGRSASRRKADESFQRLENQEGAGSGSLGSFQVIRDDVYRFLKRAGGPFEFDLIFADPPYDEVDLPRLLQAVGQVLSPDGLLVFEMRSRDPVAVSRGWKILKQKKYGSTQVLFFKRVGS